VIITSWIDKYHFNRYQKSTIVLLNDLNSIIYQRRPIKTFDYEHHQDFPDLYSDTWQLWYTNCLPLVQDCAVIIMFDQKGQCIVLTNQKTDFVSHLIKQDINRIHKSFYRQQNRSWITQRSWIILLPFILYKYFHVFHLCF
jgi:hypothetical protein